MHKPATGKEICSYNARQRASITASITHFLQPQQKYLDLLNWEQISCNPQAELKSIHVFYSINLANLFFCYFFYFSTVSFFLLLFFLLFFLLLHCYFFSCYFFPVTFFPTSPLLLSFLLLFFLLLFFHYYFSCYFLSYNQPDHPISPQSSSPAPQKWGWPHSPVAVGRLIISQPILVIETPFEFWISTPSDEIY